MLNKLIRGIYRAIRPKVKYPLTLSFTKEDGTWYIDLPSYPGPKAALAMVAGADTLCDQLSKDGTTAVVKVDNTPFIGADYALTIFAENPGGTYMAVDLSMDKEPFSVWLCDVTVFVLGEFPEYI